MLVLLPVLPCLAKTQKDAPPHKMLLPINSFSQICPMQCSQSAEVPWGRSSSSSYHRPFLHNPCLAKKQLPLPPPLRPHPTFTHLTHIPLQVSAATPAGWMLQPRPTSCRKTAAAAAAVLCSHSQDHSVFCCVRFSWGKTCHSSTFQLNVRFSYHITWSYLLLIFPLAICIFPL